MLRTISVAVLALSVTGCGALVPSSGEPAATTAAARRGVSLHPEAGRSLKAGTEAMRQGRYAEASTHINRALSATPDNARLHFLNGLTYHLMFETGNPLQADLAETGYLLALEHDPAYAEATQQLARLYVQQERWAEAQARLSDHVLDHGKQPEILYQLAYASYYAGDVATALWAIEEDLKQRPAHAETIRAATVVNAAAANAQRARSLFASLGEGNRVSDGLGPLQRRLTQWATFHAAPRLQPATLQLAQSPSPFPAPGASPSTFPPGFAPGAVTPPGPGAAPSFPPGFAPGPAPGAAAPAAPESKIKAWFECGAETAGAGGFGSSSSSGFGGSSGYGSSSGQTSDETVALTALPAPCKDGAHPRMSVVDVVVIRTEERNTTSYGVNLLGSLQAVVNYTLQETRTSGSPTIRTVTRSLGLPSGGITYALNLANAGETRNEILARPSLLVLDRQPAQFFSGAALSVAVVQGNTTQGYGTGSLQDKSVGVSLSVTPTFIDDETLLLATKVARSFFEPGDPVGTFDQSVQTSRNMVAANAVLKFGQTLVLSGLTEQEIDVQRDGVPGLKNVPLLQYLFSEKSTTDFRKSLVVLVTPRRPVYVAGAARLAREQPHAASSSVRELRQAESVPNLDAVFVGLESNRFYAQFRAGDLAAERRIDRTTVDHMLRQTLEMLYF